MAKKRKKPRKQPAHLNRRNVRITGVRRKEIDEEKLAVAFILLARSMKSAKSDQTDESANTSFNCPDGKPLV